MTLFFIMVPLMVAAVAIATIPILYHSIREHRLVHSGSADKPRVPLASGYSVRKVPAGEHRVAAQRAAA
jgi:hypothetical protein